MDAQSTRQPLAQKASKEMRRWNYTEESQLIHLLKAENKTYAEAAGILDRSTQAVQQRYSMIRQMDQSAAVTWTAGLDAALIDCRRRKLAPKQIALELNISDQAIQSRWQALKAMKKVPEDVIAGWRRKELRDFTPQEDEAILRLYVEGRDDKDIVEILKIPGKSQTEIVRRRRKLVAESSPIYRRLVSMWHGTWDEDEDNVESDALGMAVGGEKYDWMEQRR
jgi:DNA-directed RNA polymerase specialized sigma24 family protein